MRGAALRVWAAAGGLALLTACGSGAAAPGAQPPDGPAPTVRAASSSVTTAAPSPPSLGTAPGPTGSVTTASTAPTRPVSAPRTLSIPAIGVASALVELGRNPDGTVEVPSLDDPDAKPGWYRDSPAPGALGPAIILGHVDSRRFGPGVFYRLGDLHPGDAVEVTRADGTVAGFAVDTVEVVAKRDFPTLAVYGNLDHAGLRLITCGGEFDPDAGSYESNIIVFATLAG